jgi:hypothetical protein
MSETRIIRYTTKPELAEENARPIRIVLAELDSLRPAGVDGPVAASAATVGSYPLD